MNELDVKAGLVCIFEFHAAVQNGTVILDDNPPKAQLSRKLNFQHLGEGEAGVHKRGEGLSLRDLKYSASLLNLILLLNKSYNGVALFC